MGQARRPNARRGGKGGGVNGKRAGKAAARNAFETEFLSLLAHELRNPLAPIRYSAAILRMRCTQEADLNAIATIERQVAQLGNLVDDLIEGARLQRGLVSLQKQWVDIGALAQQALEAVQPLAEERGQHLEAHLPTAGVHMSCDPERLRQVLDNLLNHASLQTQAGGTLALAIEARPRELFIRISDNGLGIAPEALPHVFNLFASAVSSSDSQVKRLGVSLAIARSLVELHRGTIEVQSEGPGRGTTFAIRLPLIGKPPVARPLREAVAGLATSLRILIVEDNLDAAQSLADLLTLHGHVVLQAHDGLSALDTAQVFGPAVVLLDIALPDMDGYEVARRLRTMETLARVRLIAVTAFDAEEDLARARAAGFDSHLAKPVSMDALRKTLALGGRPARASRGQR
jgi:CheY-like chemotaxis protein